MPSCGSADSPESSEPLRAKPHFTFIQTLGEAHPHQHEYQQRRREVQRTGPPPVRIERWQPLVKTTRRYRSPSLRTMTLQP
jgi:hypothetical protein